MEDRFILPDGEKIRRLRQDHFWSQEQLAEKAGVRKRTIERAEAGQRIQPSTIRAIAQVWDLSPDQLVLSGISSELRRERGQFTTSEAGDVPPVSVEMSGRAAMVREEGKTVPSDAETSLLPGPERCTGCGYDNPASVRFCTACGLALKNRCARCGFENPLAAKFCGACATALSRQTPLPPPVQTDPHLTQQQEPTTPGGPLSMGPISSASERRQLTVLCCRLVGLPERSEPHDPEELLEVVSDYHAMCAEIVRRFEGHIAQYQGEGLVVHFGYPRAHEDDAHRAVHAGLGIVEGMARLKRSLQGDRDMQLAVRVGIHTGVVVVTALRQGDKREPLTLGDTPTIAAQLQGLAAPDTVVISPATLRLVEGHFAYRALGAYLLDDPTGLLTVYHVLQESTAQSRFDIAATTDLTPLVGREQEVGLLVERWAQVKDGMGQVVLLSGEAGIGKSRLVQTLRGHLAGEAHTRVECHCSPYYQNSALYPVIEYVQRLLQFRAEDTPQEKLRKLEGTLEPYDFSLAEVVPPLAALLSLPLPERYPPLALAPQQQKQQTLEALLAWLLKEAEQQPVCFVVEDLHWADPSTLEFFSLLIDQVPTLRVLVLLIFRPEFRPPWAIRAHLTQIVLGRLTRRQVETMLGRVTGGKTLPVEVLRQLVGKTDGVPLFVEELTKMILESGLLKETEGRYELRDPLPALTIPATLHDSLMARLDRLGLAKQLAQLGATLGREFSYELIQAVSPVDEGTLHTALTQLVDSELLYQRGLPPHARYFFKHALIQEAAYQSLLRSTRQQYHRQIAQMLEERFLETRETHPELLAHHYTVAGLSTQAIPYWAQAGQRAIERSANVEAISHLSKALDLLQTLPQTTERCRQELALRLALGPPLLMINGHTAPEVEHSYACALDLCRQVGERHQLFQVLMGLWVFYNGQGMFQRSREMGEQSLALAQDIRDPVFANEAHVVLGTTLFSLGEFVSAQAHLQQACAFYTAQPHRSGTLSTVVALDVSCFSWESWALWVLGYPDQALAKSHEALALAQEVPHAYSLGLALYMSAIFHQYRREVHQVHAQTAALLTLADVQGFARWLGGGNIIQGWAHAEDGQAEAGVVQMRQGLAAWRAMGGKLALPYLLGLLAEAYGKAQRLDEGLRVLAEALALVHENGERRFAAELHRLRGELLFQQAVRQENPVPMADALMVEAENCFQLALAVARQQQAKSLELRAVMSLSRLRQRQGKGAAAYQELATIYGWFHEGFATPDLQAAQALLAALAS